MCKSLKSFVLTVLICLTLFLPVEASAENAFPQPAPDFFINDFAGVLRDDTKYGIVELGKQLEEKTGAQVVVVTIDSLGGRNIQEYALELGREWGIGQKDKNNGVLLLNSVQDREIDIEVGYGLEGAIPDIRAREIIREYIKPRLKDGNFDTGILNGYKAIVKDVASEYNVTLETDRVQPRDTGQNKTELPGRSSHRGTGVPILIILLVILDGVFFRFRITSTLIRFVFWSNIFGGGRGGGWGGSGGGSGGGGPRGGSSGGGGSFGGGGSSDNY